MNVPFQTDNFYNILFNGTKIKEGGGGNKEGVQGNKSINSGERVPTMTNKFSVEIFVSSGNVY